MGCCGEGASAQHGGDRKGAWHPLVSSANSWLCLGVCLEKGGGGCLLRVQAQLGCHEDTGEDGQMGFNQLSWDRGEAQVL